jgi:hypothetical protein
MILRKFIITKIDHKWLKVYKSTPKKKIYNNGQKCDEKKYKNGKQSKTPKKYQETKKKMKKK